MKIFHAIILLFYLGIMIFGSLSLPKRGDLSANYHQQQTANGSPNAAVYYVQNAYKDAHTDNFVTVVLGDYRAFDTLGETVVVFTAGIVVALILANGFKKKKESV